MAQLTKETLKWLTELCCIGCSDDEQERLLAELATIVAYVDQLRELDTEGVAPCNQVIDVSNDMRDDEVGQLLPRDVFLANAPAHTGGMIKVPPVIQGKNS